MSLVAYDSSDNDSENDENQNQETLLLNVKERKPVKISIPSLKDFKEEETTNDAEAVKKVKSKAGSGLFSLLPPPKNSVTSKPGFIPYVFSKKKEVKSNPQLLNQEKSKQTIVSNPPLETSNLINDEPDSYEKIDFFSLETHSKPEVNSYSDASTSLSTISFTNLAASSSDDQCMSKASFSHAIGLSCNDRISAAESTFTNSLSEASVSVDNSLLNTPEADLLKDERFLKIKGKRGMEEINIIDINADDQLTGKDEWILQNLTQEKVQRPSKRRYDMPTQQQKRKHQITYLAFQAKERELDLKNQWALNSRTKRETQAKYGF